MSAPSCNEPRELDVIRFESGEAVELVEVVGASLPLFRSFYELRREVFCEEMKLECLRPYWADARNPDLCDRCGVFVLAHRSGVTCGGARACIISRAFPHPEDFQHHFGTRRLVLPDAAIAEVNGVCVRQRLRGRKGVSESTGLETSLAAAIMHELRRTMFRNGARVLLLGTSAKEGTHFFRGLGFFEIDVPKRQDGFADDMTNMATILLGNDDGKDVQESHQYLLDRRAECRRAEQ